MQRYKCIISMTKQHRVTSFRDRIRPSTLLKSTLCHLGTSSVLTSENEESVGWKDFRLSHRSCQFKFRSAISLPFSTLTVILLMWNIW
jgi:hypothetical protein